MDQRTFERLLAAAVLATACVISLRAPGLGDYQSDAGPALSAIAHGQLGAFFSHQPAMGALSLYLRAPFAALAVGLGDGVTGVYRWGTLPCMLAVAGVTVWLVRIALSRGAGRLAASLIAVACLINPLVQDALYLGHPEELLTASLAVGCVLAAVEQRALLTGILAGLAVASKQWALLVVLPAVLMLERERLRALIWGAGTGALVTLPMVVVNLKAFRHALSYISTPQPIVTQFTWLYPLSGTRTVRIANIFGGARAFQAHALLGVETLARPAILALALVIPLYAWWRSGRVLHAEGGLLAAAIVLLLRCALDPGSTRYYHFPALLALPALDAISGRRVPWATLAGLVVSLAALDYAPDYLSTAAANGVYIVATLAGFALLVQRLHASAAPAAPIAPGRGTPLPSRP